MNKKTVVIATIAAVLLLNACRKDEAPAPDPADTTGRISFAVPEGWPQPVYAFAGNELTQEGFELGRKLFYDVRLSRDNTIACGSCHQQFAGFAHLDHPLSHGIDGRFGTRNANSLANLAWQPSFMWDGGVNNLEVQPIAPIENHVEMDETLANVVARLNGIQEYRTAMKSVFGDETVTAQRLLKALAQFMGAMVSSGSRYDQYVRGDAAANFTAQETEGLTLFRAHCATCHKEPLFSDFSFRNNGLPPNVNYPDSGRAHITQNGEDIFRFKVPSLRNVALSRPYMHDGRFNTLEAAVNHYRQGVAATDNLDPAVAGGIALTDGDAAAIVAFLKTLTDEDFVHDTRFSEPSE